MTSAAVKTTLDVRSLAPRERHPLIFRTFNDLAPGKTSMRVNDHVPKPLYYQFQAELGPVFDWNYVESGPEAWRVKVARKVT